MNLIRVTPLLAAVVCAAAPALAGAAKGQFAVKGGKTSGAITPTHSPCRRNGTM